MAWTKLKTSGVVAAVLVLGTIAFLLGTTLTQAPGRLRDGTRVGLEKVSFGTAYSPPKSWLASLLGHLPANWLSRIKWNPGSGPTGTADREICAFWLKFSSPAAAAQSISYALADETGFEAPMIFTGFYGPYQPAGFGTNHFGLARGAATFPRRSKTILLRLYQQDDGGHRVRVAEFRIKNLGFKDSPSWKPQPLPVDQHTNGLVLTLVSAEVGTTPPGPVLAPYDRQAGEWSEFRFRVSEQGQPAAGWTIKEMWIPDTAGKSYRISAQDNGAFNGQFSRIEGDEIICVHRWESWTDEPAWKLRVHFEHPAKPGCWVEYLVRPEFLTSTAANRPRRKTPARFGRKHRGQVAGATLCERFWSRRRGSLTCPTERGT